jgi:hypothetical protein
MAWSAGSFKDEPAAGMPPLDTPETFPFPYAKPYDIQVQLMQVVFEAIENGKIAIVCECLPYHDRPSKLIILNR